MYSSKIKREGIQKIIILQLVLMQVDEFIQQHVQPEHMFGLLMTDMLK